MPSKILFSHQGPSPLVEVPTLISLEGDQIVTSTAAKVSTHQFSGGQQTCQVVQEISTLAQVPSAATCQTVTSTTARVSTHQSLGKQDSQVVQGASTSARVSSLLSSREESSEDDLLSRSELTKFFMKSCSRKHMAVLMTRRLFSPEVRMSSNASTHKKKQLNTKIIDFICRKAFLFFPVLNWITLKNGQSVSLQLMRVLAV